MRCLSLFLLVMVSYQLTSIRSVRFMPPVHIPGRFGTSCEEKVLLRSNVENEVNIEAKAGKSFVLPTNCTSTNPFAILLELTASAATSGAVAVTDQLTYMQTMTAGALSRTMAQTLMHPANTYKTLLQLKGSEAKGGILTKLTPERLLRGVDAQFIMSIPHGACYFFVIDQVKTRLSGVLSSRYSFIQDFLASTISTVFCSIVSTPQMVLTDRLMAGVYPSFAVALRSILSTEGLPGFYTGWWPALAQKIPSYG
jgi:Mitochondrial carrier protein